MYHGYFDMIQFISKHDFTTSKTVAQHFSISVRTVKTYVATINQQYDNIIQSNHKGYFVNKDAVQLLSQVQEELPQNYESRSVYIVKKLLLDHAYEINLYDLCDELYIGYSTLKGDIQKLNTAYANFKVSFVCQKDTLKIRGEEKAIRKLASFIVSSEVHENFISIEMLEENFPNLDCRSLEQSLYQILKKYHYYVNDFSLMNFILHLSIMVDRVMNGNFLAQIDRVSYSEEYEKDVLDEICTLLEETYQITLNEQERFELYVLFKSNANLTVYDNMDSLAGIVEPSLLEVIQNIMKKIDHVYGVSLQTNSFLIPFAIHMKGLLFRLKNSTMARNPMAISMKEHCPFIYDMAVFISQQIQRYANDLICEDEIAYIALHLGAEIERQQLNKTKLACVLICPNYHNMNTQVYNQLLSLYGNFMYISRSLPKEVEIEESYDLVLSTVPLHHVYPCRTYTFAPFALADKKNELMDIIQKTMKEKKQELLQHELQEYLNPALFLVEEKPMTSKKVLCLLANTLEEQGYVDASYLPSILAREEISSTAFGNIAVPHAIDVKTLKSGICIYVSKTGIAWENQVVNIVFMLAIHECDKQTFSHIYGALVDLFDRKERMNQLINSKTFPEFCHNLIE